MSTSELIIADPPRTASIPQRLGTRLLRSELRLVFLRRRNLAMLAALAAAVVLVGVIVRITVSPGSGGDGPPLLGQVTLNGFYLGLAALLFTSTLFLPMVISVVSGDSVAGEANSGTLRNLLVVPAGRTRLLVVKYVAIAAYALASVSVVIGTGLVTGLALFPGGDVVTLSGSTITMVEALGRAVLIALYMGAMLATLGMIGLFFSTLTEVPMGAMAATVTYAIVVQILDAIPQISAIHPYLSGHWWTSFIDLVRDPIALSQVGQGLAVQGGYVLVFGTLAWARFTSKDVTS